MQIKSSVALATIGIAAALAGCSQNGANKQIDQTNLCIASTDQKAMQCPEGQLILARLDPRMNERRAYNVLNTVALYCDTNYQIVHNDAGVVCVMTKDRVNSAKRKAAQAAQGNTQNSAAQTGSQ